MLSRQSKSRKSLEDIECKKRSCSRSSKQKCSKEKENTFSSQKKVTKTEQDRSVRKNLSETFKLRDIINNKDKYNALDEHMNTKGTECITTNSRYSNCQCKEMMEENLLLKQQILEYLEKIQCQVNKNVPRQLDSNFEVISRKQSGDINQFESSKKNQDYYNLNSIIQQQQMQISGLKTKLIIQQQKERERMEYQEQENVYLKNKIVQLTGEVQKMSEELHQVKFRQKF